MPNFSIDAVVTWVDGNDPELKARRYQYSQNGKEMQYELIASDIRYADDGEIKYCVASLLKFAPWLRKIFILTDGQTPNIQEFIDKNFPNRTTQIEIVDHKDTFCGYEHLLPVFNSRSIETSVWRIPDLSEHYLYLNDDFMIVRNVSPEDFFRNGRMVEYVHSCSAAKLRRKLFFQKLFAGTVMPDWRYAMMKAANLAGIRNGFCHLEHTPMAQCKSLFEEYYTSQPEVMEENMSYKFRDFHQYNPQQLNYMLAKKRGIVEEVPVKSFFMLAQPKPWRSKDYFEKKLASFSQKPEACFCCFNNLHRGTPQEREKALDWIAKRLEIKE
ncbi:MAG: Stealth CR1 domain-containing protein [Bacteroidales bacterium]|nr:Stealth CR1 domain-containing protein [Bacteroidales bacterium]